MTFFNREESKYFQININEGTGHRNTSNSNLTEGRLRRKVDRPTERKKGFAKVKEVPAKTLGQAHSQKLPLPH